MQLSDGDLVAASIELDKISFWVASADMAHDKDVPPEKVRTLVKEAAYRKKQLVVSCDANAHNSMWGSTNTIARGESILDFILGNKLSVLNLGSEPTFITKSREEDLDITRTSDMFAHKIKRWRVLRVARFFWAEISTLDFFMLLNSVHFSTLLFQAEL
ncbi:uncharacterized protein LOC118752306 [Rhagoletis pomonella]|uniref:uncharacterized protein LOC118752304 n=1 Tax=Rhagoletis pomonella TaxID=28610 RepID=UPI001784DAF0|nr:uncharacterized protein LOC118752304 [Rhagoletis pomonella]XP_036343068.1 uncharacterized protein LOC118752306 [Rhagoletis pomonella]